MARQTLGDLRSRMPVPGQQMASRSGPLEDYITAPPAGARGQVRVPNDYMDPNNTEGLGFRGSSLPPQRTASVFGRPSFELPPRGNSAQGSQGTDAVTGQPIQSDTGMPQSELPPNLNVPHAPQAPLGPQLPPGWRYED